MDRWKRRGGKSERRERQKIQAAKRKSQKKEDPEGRKVGSPSGGCGAIWRHERSRIAGRCAVKQISKRELERVRESERERDSEPQPPFDPSGGYLCHPCITTTHLSYGFLSLKHPSPPCTALLLITTWLIKINRIMVHSIRYTQFIYIYNSKARAIATNNFSESDFSAPIDFKLGLMDFKLQTSILVQSNLQ